MIAISKAGESEPLVVWRDGKEQTVPVDHRRMAAGGESRRYQAPTSRRRRRSRRRPTLACRLLPITDQTRAKYKLAEAQTGVVVTGTAPGSVAAEDGLGPGDVILRVQQTPVSTQADLHQQLDDVRGEKRHHVLVLVQGHSGLRWVPLEISPVQ